MELWIANRWRVLVAGFCVLALCLLAMIYAVQDSLLLDMCVLCSSIAMMLSVTGHFRSTAARIFTNSFYLALMLWWLGLLLLALNIFVWALPGIIGMCLMLLWLLLFLWGWLLVLNAVSAVLPG